MNKNEIIINGRLFDLKKIEDRSCVFQIIKNAMKNCDEDYFECEGDVNIE